MFSHFYLSICNAVAYSREYLLRVKSNTPAIAGSKVEFIADLLELNGTLADVGDTSLKWVCSLVALCDRLTINLINIYKHNFNAA